MWMFMITTRILTLFILNNHVTRNQNMVNKAINKNLNTYLKSSNKVDIAIFAAMPEELEFFRIKFKEYPIIKLSAKGFDFIVYEYNNKKILLAETGLGTAFAASVLTFIHQHFSPKYIFLTGTAGATHTDLKICDVVIAEKAFEAEIQDIFTLLKGTSFETCLTHPMKRKCFPSVYCADKHLLDIARNSELSEVKKTHFGTVVSSNTFPAPKELFEKIKQLNPYSIDMETSAFYQIAWLLQIPVLAVRGISNILNYAGLDENMHEADVKGSAKAAAHALMTIIDMLVIELNADINRDKNKTLNDMEAEILISHLGLKPHPEGGMFARYFQSPHQIKSSDKNRYNDEVRHAATSTYYLLKGNEFSAWHSISSDEVLHFYKGSPVIIYVINKNGELETYLLGDPIIHDNAQFQIAITGGNWFAVETVDKNSYSLIGCAVSPGFEFKDFKLAKRESFLSLYPQHIEIIDQFISRTEFRGQV